MPADPVHVFTSLYCGAIALQLSVRYREQLAFFRTQPRLLYGAPPKLLGLAPFPAVTENVFRWAGVALALSLAAAATGLARRFSLSIALVSCLVYFPPVLPLPYIRRKANLIPIVLAVLIAAPGQALLLTKIAVSMVYFSAGIEKLAESGIHWADGSTLQAHLVGNYLLNERPCTLWLAQHTRWCRWLSAGVLLWELSFWLVAVVPALAWIYVPAGILFHLGTSIFMRIDYWIYFGPVYFVFLAPWLSALL